MKKDPRRARAARLGLVRLDVNFDMNMVSNPKLPETLRGLGLVRFRDAQVHPKDAKRVWDAVQKAIDNAPIETE